MSHSVPDLIKIYHITPISSLSSIVRDGVLLSDAELRKRSSLGVSIGIKAIKERRLRELTFSSHRDLHVGECVPFYFCPRSIMLYIFHRGDHRDVEYRGVQEPIIHLVADLHSAVEWANRNKMRWAFTDRNAGARYFNDFADLHDLDKVDWKAVQTTQWWDRDIQEMKQAEYLVERSFPWELVEEIGVFSSEQLHEVQGILGDSEKKPIVRVQRTWYY